MSEEEAKPPISAFLSLGRRYEFSSSKETAGKVMIHVGDVHIGTWSLEDGLGGTGIPGLPGAYLTDRLLETEFELVAAAACAWKYLGDVCHRNKFLPENRKS